jgi:hypothetical protein
MLDAAIRLYILLADNITFTVRIINRSTSMSLICYLNVVACVTWLARNTDMNHKKDRQISLGAELGSITHQSAELQWSPVTALSYPWINPPRYTRWWKAQTLPGHHSRSSFHSSPQERPLLHAEGMGWRGCAITSVVALSLTDDQLVKQHVSRARAHSACNHSNRVHFTLRPIAYQEQHVSTCRRTGQ